MEIFTDGSHSVKPQISGIGAVVINNKKEYYIGCYTSKCVDNNVAEVIAIAFAIKFIKDNKIFDKSKDKNVIIYSDSQYAIRKIMQNSNGRDEIEQKALNYIQEFINYSHKKIHFFQIKGHTHDGTKLSYYNNIADEIAGEQRLYGLSKILSKKTKKNKYYE